MKTILLMTAVLALAACGEKKGTTSGADTSGMAPTMADTSSMTHSDSTMTRDTAK
jgi:predicted small lipoprotein YifL